MEENTLKNQFSRVRTVEETRPLRLGQRRKALGQWRKMLGQWRKAALFKALKPKDYSRLLAASHFLPEYNLNESPLGKSNIQRVDNSHNGFKFAQSASVFKTLRFLNCDWLSQSNLNNNALRAGEGRKRKITWGPNLDPFFPTSPLTVGGGRFFWRDLP